MKKEGGHIFIAAILDIIIAGITNEKISHIKEDIAQIFQVKNMPELKYILGLHIIQETGNV